MWNSLKLSEDVASLLQICLLLFDDSELYKDKRMVLITKQDHFHPHSEHE